MTAISVDMRRRILEALLAQLPGVRALWVGLLSAVGLTMQTGVVMVVHIDEAFQHSVREGRLRTRGRHHRGPR